jgi:hypothetical protein
MDRSISRRDLLLGMGASAASAFVPGQAFADEMLRLEGTDGPSAVTSDHSKSPISSRAKAGATGDL